MHRYYTYLSTFLLASEEICFGKNILETQSLKKKLSLEKKVAIVRYNRSAFSSFANSSCQLRSSDIMAKFYSYYILKCPRLFRVHDRTLFLLQHYDIPVSD
jgi:hypothetical protein